MLEFDPAVRVTVKNLVKTLENSEYFVTNTTSGPKI